MQKKLALFIAVGLILPAHALATLDFTELETYGYNDLYLLRTVPQRNVACFATADDKVFLVRRGAYVGKEFATVGKIEKNFIVMRGKMLLNGGKWYEFTFEWHVTKDIPNLQGFLKRCQEKELQLGIKANR